MKKIAAMIIAILSAVLIAPAAQAAPMLSSNDRAFLRAVRGYTPALKHVSGRILIDTAKSTCEFFDVGGDVYTAISVGTDAGLTEKEVVSVVVGAITFYCPEYEWMTE